MIKVLYVSSGTKNNGTPGVVVQNQIDSLKEIEKLKIKVFTIRKSGLLGYLGSFFPLVYSLYKFRPNVVHSHYSLSAFLSSLCLMSVWFLKCKHIVSLMGSDIQAKGWKRLLIHFFNKYKWSYTIVKSERMAKDIDLINYEIIPNGVDLNRVKPVFKESKKPYKVLFAANPKRYAKNFKLAEEALTFIDPKRAILKLIYDIPHQNLIKELNNSDIVLLTSRWEGSPNIIKEAMACNKPIVATNVGDIKELFGDLDGHYLCSQDINDIVKNLVKAIDFVEFNSQTKGRERIKKLGLSTESISQTIINLYKLNEDSN